MDGLPLSMTRTQTTAVMGGNQIKHIVRYQSANCTEGTIEYRAQQIALLRMLGQTPDLHHCGLRPFQKMNMRYTGEAWVIEMESVELMEPT